MRGQRQSCVITLAIAMILTSPTLSRAVGEVIGTSGTVALTSAPYPSPSDTQIFVFNERHRVPYVPTQILDFGSIPTGALVNSHCVQYDPASPTGLTGLGTITFDTPILGVITSTENLTRNLAPAVLATADEYFGLEVILGPYPMGAIPSSRGLGSPEDDLMFSIGDVTFTIDSLQIPVAGNIDVIRILTEARACPCDRNDDGTVDVTDLLDFLAQWFAQSGSAPSAPGTGADFTGDNIVDVQDLLAFLACWFPASAGAACP